jgi:hypothetical protein
MGCLRITASMKRGLKQERAPTDWPPRLCLRITASMKRGLKLSGLVASRIDEPPENHRLDEEGG